MGAEAFLDNFSLIAEAPGGIERLRNLVRDLAIQGKLVTQQEADGTGRELEEEIVAARNRLGSRSNVRLPKYREDLKEEDALFAAPQSWTWCRFGAVHQKLGSGSTPKGGKKVYVEEGVKFLRSQNVYNDGLRLDSVARIPPEVHELMAATAVEPHDVLLNITGASIARAALVPEDFDEANVSQHVAIVRPVLAEMREWIHLFLVSPHGYRAIMGAQVGISREGLSMSRLRDFVLPLPPLAEQARIVARVHELLHLCEELDFAQHARADTQRRFRRSCLARIRSSETGDELNLAWAQAKANWSTLTSTPASTDELRMTLRSLAIRGLLTPQSPEDEPAQRLLKRIAEEKSRTTNSRKTRQKGQTKSVMPKLASLPPSWTWTPLETVTLGMRYGTSSKSALAGSVPVLRMGNLDGGEIDWSSLKYTDDPEEIAKYELNPPAVLFNRTNSRELVGKTSIYRGTKPAIFAGYLIHVQHSLGLDPEYLNIVLNSQHARDWCWSVKSDGIGQANISASKLSTFPFPLAPYAEQRRIVARVRELMKQCDDLKVALERRDTVVNKLGDSLTELNLASTALSRQRADQAGG